MYQTEKPVYMAGIYRTWEMGLTRRFILNESGVVEGMWYSCIKFSNMIKYIKGDK